MPENSSQTVVWISSNESVVSVSAEGLVHAADNGKAYVTAVTEDGTLQASCRVIVETVHEHVWDKEKVTKQPDCKNTGAKTYTCTDCEETKTEEIPADKNRHSFGGHSVTKKATVFCHRKKNPPMSGLQNYTVCYPVKVKAHTPAECIVAYHAGEAENFRSKGQRTGGGRFCKVLEIQQYKGGKG